MQFHSPLRTFPKVPTSLRVLLTALALFLIGQPGYTSDTQRQPAVSDIQPQMSPVEPAEPVVTLLDMRDFAWREGGLRQAYFQDREIIENDDVIELDAPGRADDQRRRQDGAGSALRVVDRAAAGDGDQGDGADRDRASGALRGDRADPGALRGDGVCGSGEAV